MSIPVIQINFIFKKGLILKNLVLIPLLLSIVACAGVPKYQVSSDVEHTEISISSSNDSTDTTVRRLDASIYKGMCKVMGDGMHIGYALENDITQTIPPALIPTGKEITLTVVYQDARFAQNRFCGSTVQFTPLKEHKYKGHLYVSEEGQKCALKITDITDDRVIDLNVPKYACSYTGVADYKNMQPVHLNWNITVEQLY